MAAPSINSKIKLDGEREYKAALAEIKSGLNVLKSELNLASEQFRDNADSVEALTKKNDILDRTILTQKEKIEQIEKALQSSASAYGEADERTNRWKTQLNNAQAELVKMERALKDNEDALQKAQKETDGTTTAFGKLKKALSDTKEQGGGIKGLFSNLKEEFSGNDEVVRGLGDALTDVAGKFGIQLPEGAQKAVESLNGIHAGAALAVTGLGLVVAAVIKTEKALISMTKESAAYVDNILTMSQTTGQSAEQLQEFSYATELLDVSMDTLQGSLTKLTNNMQNAINGTGDAKSAFEQLGISLTNADGSMRSANDVFYDTIDALGEVQNATERDALSMDIFGRSAQDLNPLIIQGSDTLKDYAKEAHDVGYVLDNEALEALGAVDDGFQRLQKTQESVKNQMAAEFAPYLTKALEDIRELIQKVGKALVESGAVDAFGSILESSVALLEPLGSLISAVLPALTAALKPIAETVALIADTANVIVGLFTFNGDKIKTALGLNASSGQLSNMQRASGAYNGYRYSQSAGWITEGTYTDAELRSMYNSEVSAGTAQGTFEAWKNAGSWRRNASGTDWFPGGRTLLSEHGAETAILPQGTRILTAQETRQTGGDTYNITIDAHTVREFEDILRIVQDRRRVVRMGGT
jgi:hypothetical protein|nr:MAG TPA: tail tape measure [Caudoviricetes sp.]